MTEIKEGDNVVWTSQAAGVWKEKRGVVIGVAPKGTPIFPLLPLEGIPNSRRKFDSNYSTVDRILVEVPRGGKSKLSDFYAPRLSQVIKVEKS